MSTELRSPGAQGGGVRLRAYVKGVGEACALPGVRVTSQTSMSARAA